MAAVSRQKVRDALEPVVATAGYDLEDVSVTAAGKRSVLRVVVDRDGGVDLDAVADISRVVSTALDADNVMGDAPYVLEVTSPGVDRPLTLPRHWRRNAGRLVQATIRDEGTVRGRIVSADDNAATLDIDGATRTLPYDVLGPGHVQVEFDRAGDTR